MATLDDIATWVYLTMLKRTGDTDIRDVARDAALNFYLVLCDAVPFDELMTTSAELALVVGQDRYTIGITGGSENWLLTTALRSIASTRITYSASNKRRLRRSHTRVYDSLSFTQNGRSATYARWGNAIELSPPPDSASYTVRLRYWMRPTIVAAPNSHTTTILLPNAWLELMRWETLFRTYWALDQQEKAMALVAPTMTPIQAAPRKTRTIELGIIPKLWNDLLQTTSQRENVDEDFSINPTIRAYSIT